MRLSFSVKFNWDRSTICISRKKMEKSVNPLDRFNNTGNVLVFLLLFVATKAHFILLRMRETLQLCQQ